MEHKKWLVEVQCIAQYTGGVEVDLLLPCTTAREEVESTHLGWLDESLMEEGKREETVGVVIERERGRERGRERERRLH